jgi:hypothetical protein
MIRPLVSLGLGAFLLFSTSAARADVPPFCTDFDADVTCAEADVGYACPSGGSCYKIGCGDKGNSAYVYKCETCPVFVADAAGTCKDFSNVGKSCGADGTATCDRVSAYCNGYIECVKPGDAHQGQGGEAGSWIGPGGSGGEGGAAAGAGGAAAGAGGTTGGAGGTSAAGGAAGGAAVGGAAGTSAAGSPAAGSPAAGTSAAGTSAAGTSAAGTAATPAASSDSGDSGCSMSTQGRHNALAAFLALAGAAALLLDRRRR